MLTPLQSLAKSRKFMVLMLDTIVSMILFFGGKYFDPNAMEDVKFLIGALQPVALVIIGAIAYEDAKVMAEP